MKTPSALAALLALAAPAPAAQLIANGDFELGNVGFTSGYRFSPGNILDLQTYDVVTDPRLSQPFAASYGDHTTGTGLMMAVNAASVPNVPVWSQTVAVLPGADYDFSLWVSSWFALSPARLEVLFDGVSAGTAVAPLATGIWQEFRALFNPGPRDRVTITIVNRNTDFSGNDFALDDISLVGPAPAAVPGPAGLPLAAVGAVACLGYRRLRGRCPGARGGLHSGA